MSSMIVNRPNNIREKQIAMQAESGKAYVYLRGRGKYYFPAYMALFTVSFVGANYQLFQYIRGKAKKVGDE